MLSIEAKRKFARSCTMEGEPEIEKELAGRDRDGQSPSTSNDVLTAADHGTGADASLDL